MEREPKPVEWIASSRKDLGGLPKSGIKTPLADIDVVKVRLKAAEELHATRASKEAGS